MKFRSDRKVKIVCTLGPATSQEEKIYQLIQNGMDVARLNFSHGDHSFHRGLIQKVRSVSQELGHFTGIMQDLQGPKIRIGKLPANGVVLEAGDVVLLYPEGSEPKLSADGKKLLPISAEIAHTIAKDVEKGARILFDDGKICSIVKKVQAPDIVVEVEVGGLLTSHKGMNLPDSPLSVPCCMEKDLADMKFGLDQGVDAIALSFVRSASDIRYLKDQIRKNSNYSPLVISKIERPEAIENMHDIIDVSDGLLVARGDMAVEMGAGRVPIIQKELIHACNEVGVPIITATQMLESMIIHATPTRAEANDVANAVFDGTDAVMLSGETASGRYPNEAVRTMAEIIEIAEQSSPRYSVHAEVLPMPGSIVDSVEFSAARIAQHVGAVSIACLTHSGHAARTLAKYRPATPIVAIMDHEESLRKLAFVWGVRGVIIPEIVATDDLLQMVEETLGKNAYAEDGDLIVVTAGVPTLRRGTTNMIKVHRMGASIERGKGARLL
jgi:pyruvate kinase